MLSFGKTHVFVKIQHTDVRGFAVAHVFARLPGMSQFWIRKNRDWAPAGPFSLQDLRGLSSGGFLPLRTEISFAPVDGYFALGENAVLVDAIASPEVYDDPTFVARAGMACASVRK